MQTYEDDNLSSTQSLDLSSFPLLRPDQLHLYEYELLLQSEEALSAIISQEGDNIEPGKKEEDKEQQCLIIYAARLIRLISREKARRRVQSLLISDQEESGKNIDASTSSRHDNHCGKSSNNEIDNELVSLPSQNSRIRSMPSALPKKDSTNSKSLSETLQIAYKEPQRTQDHTPRMNPFLTNSIPMQGKKKKPKTKQRRVDRQNVESRNMSNFVVTSSNKRNGSFRARAKATNAVLKAKAHISSDEHQKHLVDEKKRKRRQLAIERMRNRRLIMKKRWQQREERKRHQREKREKNRESEQMAIAEEMAQVASKAKSLLVAKGETEDMANEAAAIAATKVLEKATVNVIDSDSESSLGSKVDESIVLGKSFSMEKGDATLFIHVDSSTKPIQTEPEDFNYVKDVDVCRHRDSSSCDDEHFFGSIEAKASSNIEHPDIMKSSKSHSDEESQKEKINHKEEVISRQIPIFQDNSFSTENDDVSSQRVEGIGNTKILVDLGNEVTWHPWNSNKKISQKLQSNCTITKYEFTKIFPTFHSIFTAFSCTTSRKKTDLVSQKERACLEYQIKIHTVLMDLVVCSTENNTNDSFGSLDTLTFNASLNENFNKNLFKVNSWRQEVNSIISDVLCPFTDDDTEWIDVTNEHGVGNCWNLLWTWKKPKFNPEHVLSCQKISRFKNAVCLTRKDFLKKQLQKFCNIKNCNAIMPLTFVLPREYNAFISAFYSCHKSSDKENVNIWIMKPVGMSRGRGITLIDNVGEVSYSLPSVIQQYITNPLLFHGYKFDLRLYVTVLSFAPSLEAFIYKEGFARFGSRKFTARPDKLGDIQIHLTNSSIQKDYTSEIIAKHPVRLAGSCGGGNKVKISWLWKQLNAVGLSSEIIWKRITQLCSKTLTAVCDDIPYQPNAFELFGFDIIIDSNLRPWLIEVNACPSLARDTNIDSVVKEALIGDTVRLVNPCRIDRLALKNICERRLYRAKKSPVKHVPEKDQLEEDLRKIFCDTIPRQYGDFDENLNYERLVSVI